MKSSIETASAPARVALPNIDRLIVIAAPSCCGKSTLIGKIKNNEFPELSASLDLGNHDSWLFIDSDKLPELSQTYVSKMVLHYALPSLPLKKGVIPSIADDAPMAILGMAREVAFVTLHASPTTLLSRIRSRKESQKSGRWPVVKNFVDALTRISFLRSHSNLLRKMFRLKELEKLFSNPSEISRIYRYWFDFSRPFQAKIDLIVNTEGAYTVQSINEINELPFDQY